MLNGNQVIALEEHYADAAVGIPGTPMGELLEDFVGKRLQDMDDSGVDIQVLSLAPPGMQAVLGTSAVEMARSVNNRLAQRIRLAANRFAAFAALPTAYPEAAADELERCVVELGFCGAMIHGPTDGRFLDDIVFDPILARAAKLDVPIYIHPSPVLESIRKAYLAPYDASHPMFAHAAWGFTIETGTHAMRMVLGGAFERNPGLQVILGHLGEAIPYLAPRIEEALGRNTPMKDFSTVFKRHFHVTTSGFFSHLSAKLCIDFMGIDRVMFSVDWPYAPNQLAMGWVRSFQLGEVDMSKLLHRNAQKLLRLGR